MTLSAEAEKYRTDFVRHAATLSEKLKAQEFKGDLELIKAVNAGIEELRGVRDKHLRQ